MLRVCSAETTGLPSPGPLTRAAMVAIDRAAIVHWLTPDDDRPSCHRQLHLPERLPRGQAEAARGLDGVGRDGLDAVLGDPHQRGWRRQG